MIVPKWPYPTSLHYHNTTVGEWQDLDDQPTHFEVCYDLLDVDKSGRQPNHPDYVYCPKSPFYYLTRQCQTLRKVRIFILDIDQKKYNKIIAKNRPLLRNFYSRSIGVARVPEFGGRPSARVYVCWRELSRQNLAIWRVTRRSHETL